MKRIPSFATALRLAVPLAVGVTISDSLATPYATSLTNDAGVVSFRLNQTTATNDTVWVISNGGAVTNVLQSPKDDPNNFIGRGLIVTNLGIAPGTFKIYVKHIGSGVISTNSPRVPFGNATVTGLRGIAVNPNPASPYFGWVYIVNSQTNTAIAAGSRGDGMFAFGADLGSATSDILGQGNVPKTGGYNFGSPASQQASSPYHVSIAPDDSVLVTDWSDASGNLIAMDPLLNSFTYVLKPFEGSSAAAPVGSNNNHGSISGAFIVGTGANRVLYTSDEDYQTDPATGAATEWNSIWRYDIGNGPLPWSNAPNRKIMTTFLATFAGQNQKVEVVGNYLYANQRRANFPQHDVYVVDLNNLQDPATFTGTTPWGHVWASQDASLADGYSNDLLRDTMTTAVSPDGKWFAAINAGAGNAITTPDGVTYQNAANDIIVCPLTNGIPHLAARQVFKPGGPALGRDIAFDAAHNIYFVSSGLAVAQSLDLGESTEATTGSDGTFTLSVPATQVSVSPSTPVAYEQGTVPGVFTITRTPEDIGNPVTVFYTISGTASNGVDYAILTNRVTIAAGQTTTNITVTPVDDALPELSETVVLSIQGSGGYSVGFPLSAIVAVVDNETPQLQILSLSTNIYQGNSNDYAALIVRRLGDTNVTLTLNASDFAFGGTAVLNTDYYLANLPITIPGGVVNSTNNLIYPIKASTAVGSLSLLLTNLAGAGYTVTNNSAATTLTLQAVPPGTVLFSDNFETDTTANYDIVFGTLSNAPVDFSYAFSYDYAAGDVSKNLPGFPPAPNSTGGGTKGLYLTVNKADGSGVAAALNAYLKNQNFSGNFALRFDMMLIQNSGPVLGTANQSKNETALFGINHSGTRTNWIRNAVPGTGPVAGSGHEVYQSDGLFCSIEADAFSPGLNFGLWSGPTWTNTAAVVGPTNFLQRAATTTRQIFKKPPFDAGPALGGVPANTVLSTTPTWVEVELSQIGNLLTWKINNTVILSYFNTNTATTNFTSGRIMLGYNDPWDDIGNQTAGSGEACVIYDNVRVVSVAPPTILTHPSNIVAIVGTATNLSVVASTVTGVTNYQWLRNGTNLVGQTNATLNFAPLATANFGGNYSVAVSDGAYTTWSAVATVLPPPPSVVSSPTSKIVPYGRPTSFSGSGATSSGVTNYQWMRGSPLANVSGANYSGITNTTLNIAAVVTTNVGPYALRIGDGFSFVTSSVANLTIAAQPTITSSLSGSTLNLSFPTEVGPQYITEWKGALTNGPWNPILTNIGDGNPVTVQESTLTEAQRFFRVRMQ
jgi:hypothetical protein